MLAAEGLRLDAIPGRTDAFADEGFALSEGGISLYPLEPGQQKVHT